MVFRALPRLGGLAVLLAATAASAQTPPAVARVDEASLDRSVLPIAEPSYPASTVLDVRNATPPPRFVVEAPKGAPNVLVILIDNLGFGATKPFGGTINMPTLERLANDGILYNNFHTAPLCAPSRMALLTGRNPHSVNMGAISEMATAFPGQTSVLPQSKASLPAILKMNGYTTAMFGKSHEFSTWAIGITGPFGQWPTGGFGFDRFYGTLSAESDLFAPPLRDNFNLVDLPKHPNYYYQTDLANHAIDWIRTEKSLTPDKPFFIYYATPGTHAPSQVPAAWLDRYKGKFDRGWDKAREDTLARQKALGIVPPNTKLSPPPKEMPAWDSLSADERKIYARQEEIFAAYAEITDYEVGRVVKTIDDLGIMDNTLIIYISGDNGSSANGGPTGHFNTLYAYNQVPETLADQLKHLSEFGGPKSDMTPPLGWAIADNTPFAYAQGTAALGGTSNGVVVHWPNGINAKHEIRSQYFHLIDIAPTVLEAAHVPEPKKVNGTVQQPMEGVSMGFSFEDAQRPSPHTIQYTEFMGNRGIYKNGWYASTLHRAPWDPTPRTVLQKDVWELCDLTNDFSCATDLAGQFPDRLKELQAAFLSEAVKYNVLPLDDRVYERLNPAVAGRPDIMNGRTTLTLYDGMVGMTEGAFINTKNHSHSIVADLVTPSVDASGVIIAQGGQGAGWSLYVKKGRPRFAYNYLGNVTTLISQTSLPKGPVRLAYHFAYDGGKPGAGGTGTLYIDGKVVASGRIEHTIPFIFSTETADVGMDLYTPVTLDYKQGNNRFTGHIRQITIDLDKMNGSDEKAWLKAKAETIKVLESQD